MTLSSRFKSGPGRLALIFALLLAGTAWYRLLNRTSPVAISGTRIKPARVIPDQEFSPVVSGQQPAKLSDWRGKWVVLFFGYTGCPDVCPTTMHYLQEEYAGLLENRDAATVLMVSIDPANDTPAKVAEYAKFYEPRFIGVVSPHTEPLTTALGVASQSATATSGIQHSGDLFIISPSGKWTALYRPPLVKGALAKDLRNFILAGES